ncbi:MAG: hypothetical protein ACYC8T_07955 [Myxococcaceae bacterium]
MKLAQVAALVCSLASGSALASGERIVILASDRAVRQQLTDTLCVSQECVPPEKILTAGRPDFAKASRERLTAVVVGRLSKSGSACSLELSLLGRGGATRLSRTVPADSAGKVSIIDVVSASSEVITYVERPESKDPKVAKVAKAPVGKGKASRLASRHKVKVVRKVAARTGGRSRG